MDVDTIKKMTPEQRAEEAEKRLAALEAGTPEEQKKAKAIRAIIARQSKEEDDDDEEEEEVDTGKKTARIFSIPSAASARPMAPAQAGHHTEAIQALQAAHKALQAHVVELGRRHEALLKEHGELRVALARSHEALKTQGERTHALLRRFAGDLGVAEV